MAYKISVGEEEEGIFLYKRLGTSVAEKYTEYPGSDIELGFIEPVKPFKEKGSIVR